MKSVTITDASGHEFTVRCRDAVYELILESFDLITGNRFRSEKITLTDLGLNLQLRTRTPFDVDNYRYVDFGWERFVKDNGLGTFTLTGMEAKRLWDRFFAWAFDVQAAEAIQELESGKTTFQELGANFPHLQHHPEMQKYAAKVLFEDRVPSRKKGRQPGTRQPENVLELLAWVQYYIGRDQMTVERAASIANKEHADLIPAEWTKPDVALAKAYHRQPRDTK